tara:strand:- start:1068 stop:1601 length:534 start_codon:yes stop_codon:yes gene_type:complete
MSFLDNLPDNYNLLSPVGFRLTFRKLPNVAYFCQTINIPDLSVSEITVPTPMRDFPIFGDNLTIGTVDLSFVVDEDLANYQEIQLWMRGLTSPDDFTSHRSLIDSPTNNFSDEGDLLSDATLHILTNTMNNNKNVEFKGMFPTSLGAVEFTTQDTEVSAITVSASFAIRDYIIKTVT